jgi:hypothetical protein
MGASCQHGSVSSPSILGGVLVHRHRYALLSWAKTTLVAKENKRASDQTAFRFELVMIAWMKPLMFSKSGIKHGANAPLSHIPHHTVLLTHSTRRAATRAYLPRGIVFQTVNTP